MINHPLGGTLHTKPVNSRLERTVRRLGPRRVIVESASDFSAAENCMDARAPSRCENECASGPAWNDPRVSRGKRLKRSFAAKERAIDTRASEVEPCRTNGFLVFLPVPAPQNSFSAERFEQIIPPGRVPTSHLVFGAGCAAVHTSLTLVFTWDALLVW
jgi:hypothetical protein